MKKFAYTGILLLLLFSTIVAEESDQPDQVLLMNGATLQGDVIADVEGEYIRLQVSENRIYELKYRDVKSYVQDGIEKDLHPPLPEEIAAAEAEAAARAFEAQNYIDPVYRDNLLITIKSMLDEDFLYYEELVFDYAVELPAIDRIVLYEDYKKDPRLGNYLNGILGFGIGSMAVGDSERGVTQFIFQLISVSAAAGGVAMMINSGPSLAYYMNELVDPDKNIGVTAPAAENIGILASGAGLAALGGITNLIIWIASIHNPERYAKDFNDRLHDNLAVIDVEFSPYKILEEPEGESEPSLETSLFLAPAAPVVGAGLSFGIRIGI